MSAHAYVHPSRPTYTYNTDLYLPTPTYIDMDRHGSLYWFGGCLVQLMGSAVWTEPSCHSGAEDPGAAILALFISIALYFVG